VVTATGVDMEAATRLVSRLSSMDSPPESSLTVRSAGDLLNAFVAGCDGQGRYFACPYLLRRLFWWQDVPVPTVAGWLAELVERGDIEIRAIGHNVYETGDRLIDIACLIRPRRYARFAARRPIPASVRQAIYERDSYTCVTCDAYNTALSLDHIIPVSRGGSDDPSNLQTMCLPCNLRKGARV
jgi:5-methylcytosine-specific restriction protein A